MKISHDMVRFAQEEHLWCICLLADSLMHLLVQTSSRLFQCFFFAFLCFVFLWLYFRFICPLPKSVMHLLVQKSSRLFRPPRYVTHHSIEARIGFTSWWCNASYTAWVFSHFFSDLLIWPLITLHIIQKRQEKISPPVSSPVFSFSPCIHISSHLNIGDVGNTI